MQFPRIAAAALLFIVPAFAAGAENASTPAAEIAKLFARWDRRELPGCAVAVVLDGRVVFRRGFGAANLDHEAPNTPQTVFEIGSATKSFVSACLAILFDEGKVSPADDVRKYIPELQRHKTPIRIKHLVRCRSGTWDHWHAMQLAGWSSEPVESPYTEADALELLSRQKRLPFEPGTKFHYGSGDYFLLGIVIRRVTGKSLAEFSRDRLFKSLGMTRTYFETDPTRVVEGRATGYYRGVDGRWRGWTSHSGGIGGWGLKTCVDDLVRWNANFDKSRLPAGKYLDEFLRSGMLLQNANVVSGNRGKPYLGLRRVECTGGMPGFMAAMTRFPERKLTVICLANNGEIHPSTMSERIADLVLGLKPPKKPKSRAKESQAVKLTAEQLRDKVGVWSSRYEFIHRVVLDKGRLYFVHHLGQKYLLKPVDPLRFALVGYSSPGNTLVYNRKSADQPYALSLEWPGGKESYQPITLYRPTARQLQEYAGEFSSDELRTTYRFRVRRAKLWLQVNSRAWEPLEATVRATFVPQTRKPYDNRIFRFRREPKRGVVRVDVSLWRVSDVGFQKQQRTAE